MHIFMTMGCNPQASVHAVYPSCPCYISTKKNHILLLVHLELHNYEKHVLQYLFEKKSAPLTSIGLNGVMRLALTLIPFIKEGRQLSPLLLHSTR